MNSTRGIHRPLDWTPVADADPVPGDPVAIREEAEHMKQVARSLREQAADLRVIARSEELKGKYADRLRDDAMELERHLREVAERYEHVHGHLSAWSGELEALQDESIRLLHNARSAGERGEAARYAAVHTAAAHHADGRTATPPARHKDARHDDAIHPYRVSLSRLTDHRDRRAVHYARQISAACDDVIKDSSWETFSDGLGDVLGNRWLSDLFNAVGVIVSTVGIAALFCTPVGWIIMACTAVGMAMAVKDILAAATGNGSWLDVGMDVLGFLGGFALGRALKALRTIRAATKAASGAAAADAAEAQVMRESENVMRRSYRTVNSRTATRASRARAYQARGEVRARIATARDDAEAAEHARSAPEPSCWIRAWNSGDEDGARDKLDIDDMRARYPNSPEVRHAGRHAGSAMGAARGIAGANMALDWGGKAAGAWSKEYGNLESRFTVSFGSQW